jgi:hypothetical protein
VDNSQQALLNGCWSFQQDNEQREHVRFLGSQLYNLEFAQGDLKMEGHLI